VKQQPSNEFGFMQITLVVLMGLFLTMAALALDLGNLYLWRLRAQKAAHAGAMAGLGYRINNGWTTTITRVGINALNQVATQAVQDNFTMYGSAASPGVSTTFSQKDDIVTVSVTYNAPTFFVGRLNNFFNFGLTSDSTTVSLRGIQSSAQLNPATIVLLLDVSGSMTSNIQILIDAASTFVKQFNPNTDRISIIPFNIGAQVQYALNPTGFDNVAMLSYLQTLAGTTKSNTNHCDALTEAILDLQKVAPQISPTNTLIRPSIVFFTDGAPNALRATFSQVHPQGVIGGPHDQDGYLYTVEWFDGSTTTPYAYRGPGPVVFRPSLATATNPMFGFQIQTNQVAPSGWTMYPPNFATDIANVSNPRLFRQILDRTQSGNGCLQSLNLYVTGTGNQAKVIGIPFESAPTSAPDPDWPPRFFQGLPAGTTYNYQYFDQLPYYCAIEAADYLRKTYSANLYTIGLGTGAQASPDPFQDADLSDSANPANAGANPRKDYFLARLAFAPQSMSSTSWGQNYDFASSRTISVNSTNSPGHRYSTANSAALQIGNTSSESNPQNLRTLIPSDLGNNRHYDTQGEYFPTTNAADLPGIYRKIARTILLRAVQ
jgi:hypothetical protein